MIRTSWLVMCAVLVGLLREATADTSTATEPTSHAELATAAYQAGDYETASRELEAAYAEDARPDWLYAWAQARRLGGHCDEALPLYERYIATQPTEANITAARTGMSLCEQSQPPPPPPPPPQPQPGPTTRRAWYDDRVADALVIGGTVVTGVGIGFFVLAMNREDDAHRARYRDDFGELLDEATVRKRIGGVCISAGAALAFGGLVRYLLHRDEPAPVTVGATASSISVLGRF